MITRHHVALALLCSLTLACAAGGFDPFFALVLAGGTLVGVILPDIHMKRPKKNGFLTIGWCIAETGRQICVPVLSGMYRLFRGSVCEPNDKRLTHSVPGFLVYSLVITAVILPPALLAEKSIAGSFAMVFLAGTVLGYLLHLLEDLCTRKGITVFFPYSEQVIRGSIRPCDTADPRIGRFHVTHCLVLGAVAILCVVAQTPDIRILLGFLGVAACVATMILQSDVHVMPGKRITPDPGDTAVA